MSRFEFTPFDAPSRRGFLKGSALASVAATIGVTGAAAEDEQRSDEGAVRGAMYRHDLLPGGRFEVSEADLSTPASVERTPGEYRAHAIEYLAAPSRRAFLFAPTDAPVDAGDRYELRADVPTPLGETSSNLVSTAFDPA